MKNQFQEFNNNLTSIPLSATVTAYNLSLITSNYKTITKIYSFPYPILKRINGISRSFT